MPKVTALPDLRLFMTLPLWRKQLFLTTKNTKKNNTFQRLDGFLDPFVLFAPFLLIGFLFLTTKRTESTKKNNTFQRLDGFLYPFVLFAPFLLIGFLFLTTKYAESTKKNNILQGFGAFLPLRAFRVLLVDWVFISHHEVRREHEEKQYLSMAW
ncbi:hypothetical protein [Bowmanella pacifica]|uniref:hypothetical protein n=1 Tax=Bowmanella pacifica TaxID=502051 RepID=UPI001664CD53|nr:hypothetical protein [Bowmanella pacifica]